MNKEELKLEIDRLNKDIAQYRKDLDDIKEQETLAEIRPKYEGKYFKKNSQSHGGMAQREEYFIYFYVQRIITSRDIDCVQVGDNRSNKKYSIKKLHLTDYSMFTSNFKCEDVFVEEITKEEYTKAFKDELRKLRLHGKSIFDKD